MTIEHFERGTDRGKAKYWEKNQSLISTQGNNRCSFRNPCKTHECTPRAQRSLVVRIVSTGCYMVNVVVLLLYHLCAQGQAVAMLCHCFCRRICLLFTATLPGEWRDVSLPTK